MHEEVIIHQRHRGQMSHPIEVAQRQTGDILAVSAVLFPAGQKIAPQSR